MAWFRPGRSRAPAERVPIVLYTRHECPLCDEMKAEMARARLEREYELREVDIDSDRVLVERFGRRIPVLEIGGEVAFEARLTAGEFERTFWRIAPLWRRRPRPEVER